MRLRAICFDYGGTLDDVGGVHWLPRFAALYQRAGLHLPFEQVRDAFDHATHCAYTEPGVSALRLQALIEFHVARQMERLQLRDTAVATAVVDGFVRNSRVGLEASRSVLKRLRGRVSLGVISNFYGNVKRILEDAQIAPLLDAVVDSTCVRLSKPDPQIFALAVQQFGCAPAEVLYVGDSFEKDVVGARRAGLRTAWFVGAGARLCSAPEMVDVRLRSLGDLDAIVA
ncbi:MAG: HAD family hydrolase [Candidatus Binatia bacterium]